MGFSKSPNREGARPLSGPLGCERDKEPCSVFDKVRLGALLSPLLGEGKPLLNRPQRKVGTLVLTSPREDLVEVFQHVMFLFGFRVRI